MQYEIDEAAWMGISFAGSPAMVFYEQLKNALPLHALGRRWTGHVPHQNLGGKNDTQKKDSVL
ncbi:hypothetical protein ACFL5Z_12120 [Planctomycetota bacterium]